MLDYRPEANSQSVGWTTDLREGQSRENAKKGHKVNQHHRSN